jgi:V8-like Glu-specific endopeptidase
MKTSHRDTARLLAWVIFCPALTVSTALAAEQPAAAGSETVIKHVKTFRVFGAEDRRPIDDTTVAPWSSMGLVIAQWGRPGGYQSRTGTGTLISDRVVLSCAHVVYDTGIGWAESITFYPGKDGSYLPFGTADAVQSAVTDAWASSRDDNYDVSLLLLDTPIGQEAGTLAVASKPASFFADRTLNMSGYPSDLDWDRLFSAAGQSTRVDGNLIVHTIDGGAGQSGGPVWYDDASTGQNTIVGIYTGEVEVTEGGRVTDVYGIAVRIDSEICNWITTFLNQHDPGTTVACDASESDQTSPLCGQGVPVMIPLTVVALALMGRAGRASK